MNLVFAHGYWGWSQTSPIGINYFRGLQAHITKLGSHAALFRRVPPFGTYEERARVLADAIQQGYPEGPIHIIAHSMGGLDSRALIAHNLHGLSDSRTLVALHRLPRSQLRIAVALSQTCLPVPNRLARAVYCTMGLVVQSANPASTPARSRISQPRAVRRCRT